MPAPLDLSADPDVRNDRGRAGGSLTGELAGAKFCRFIARLEAAIYEATVKTIVGAGHLPHLTHADEWRAIVSEFARGAR